MGGLSKKATQLATLRTEKPDLLILDSGGLLFKDPSLPAGQGEQLKATARGIVAAYNAMGFQAVGVAGQDLAGGLDFLLAVRKESRFPWLSANLTTRDRTSLPFAPHALLKGAGLRIGVIGLTGMAAGHPPPSDYVLLPWQETLPAQLGQLAGKTDLLILLSSLPPLENRRIAEAHPEIHLILQAGSGGGNMAPELINNTVITQTEQQGKQIGLLDIQWNPAARQWQRGVDENPLQDRQNALDRTEWQLSRLRRHGAPETVYRDQPQMLANYRELLTRREELAREIASLRAAAPKQLTAQGGSFFSRFFPLDSSVADHDTVRAIVDKATEEANRIGRKRAQTTTSPPAGYAGNSACAGCHQAQLAKWSASRHARAYDTLVAKGQQFNAGCVPCHVTGAFAEPAERLLAVAAALPQVGCETCHGPAGSHAARPESQRPGQPSQSICQQCHTPEHDDNFNYTIDLGRLRCGE
ncbi:MAG: UshA-like (seleno)protein [Thermodesulfobacteriota bacterium]